MQDHRIFHNFDVTHIDGINIIIKIGHIKYIIIYQELLQIAIMALKNCQC